MSGYTLKNKNVFELNRFITIIINNYNGRGTSVLKP